ncbi:hypothetical protein GCM10010530_00320 [Kribbella aluminosa]
MLDGELTDPRALIRTQLGVVEEQLAAAGQVRDKLFEVLDGLERAHDPSAQTLIEVTTAMNRTLTHEEFQAMAETRRRLTESLTPEEREARDARRQQAMRALTPEERERMHKARQSLLPHD